jgi:hypothetical protein
LCFNSYEYRENLKNLGFFYASSKKAWCFSGNSKKMVKSRKKINQIRDLYGSEVVKEKKNIKKLS